MTIVDELRELIVEAAPEPARAAGVRTCGADEPLDAVLPFSSIAVLGTVVAIEDRYGIVVRKADLARALAGGVTLQRLATIVEELRR
jgi:acyl carrier protein